MTSSIARAVVLFAALVAISTAPGVFAEAKVVGGNEKGASGMDIVDLLDKDFDNSFDLPDALRELTDLTLAPSASPIDSTYAPTASPTAAPTVSAAALRSSSSTMTSVVLVLATAFTGAFMMAW